MLSKWEIALAEGKDLFVKNDNVFMKTVKGPLKVDCIYRRIDDWIKGNLDPDDKVFVCGKNYFIKSVIGVPGKNYLNGWWIQR